MDDNKMMQAKQTAMLGTYLILTTMIDLGEDTIPRSSLYLTLGQNIQLENVIVAAGEACGFIKVTGSTITITDKGKAKGIAVNAILAKSRG